MLGFTDPAEVVEEIAKAELGSLNGFEPPDRSRWPRSGPPLSKDRNVALSKTLLKSRLYKTGRFHRRLQVTIHSGVPRGMRGSSVFGDNWIVDWEWSVVVGV
jgi:hypothetical protein